LLLLPPSSNKQTIPKVALKDLSKIVAENQKKDIFKFKKGITANMKAVKNTSSVLYCECLI